MDELFAGGRLCYISLSMLHGSTHIYNVKVALGEMLPHVVSSWKEMQILFHILYNDNVVYYLNVLH